jgi:hypothetical protein
LLKELSIEKHRSGWLTRFDSGHSAKLGQLLVKRLLIRLIWCFDPALTLINNLLVAKYFAGHNFPDFKLNIALSR